jgi:hypothetical protein
MTTPEQQPQTTQRRVHEQYEAKHKIYQKLAKLGNNVGFDTVGPEFEDLADVIIICRIKGRSSTRLFGSDAQRIKSPSYGTCLAVVNTQTRIITIHPDKPSILADVESIDDWRNQLFTWIPNSAPVAQIAIRDQIYNDTLAKIATSRERHTRNKIPRDGVIFE